MRVSRGCVFSINYICRDYIYPGVIFGLVDVYEHILEIVFFSSDKKNYAAIQFPIDA